MSSLQLLRRMNGNLFNPIHCTSLNLHRFYSSKIKSKPKQKSVGKSKSKSKVKIVPKQTDNLYESQSLSDYIDKSNDKSTTTGWNGTFYRCYNLLSYNPLGITSMMHSFNTTSTCVGGIFFVGIYGLSYYSIYSFPASWLFSWIIIRLFSDIFPIFPKIYSSIIEQNVFNRYPILRHLTFSRKLPNPDLQSFSLMVKDRLNEQQKLKYKKKLLRKGNTTKYNMEDTDDIDLDDIHISDDTLAKGSVLANWKIKGRANAKKYGLSWDLVENTSTLILMPGFMCLFEIIGISDALVNILLENDNIISGLLASNNWIIKGGISYVVATYLTRLASIPIFRYYCVPRATDKFGPYSY